MDIIARELKALDNELGRVGGGVKSLHQDAGRLRPRLVSYVSHVEMVERTERASHGAAYLNSPMAALVEGYVSIQ